MRPTPAVIGAGGVVIGAAAIALEATTFDVAFPTDPLGPKAFPILAAFLLAIGGVALMFARPGRTGPALGSGMESAEEVDRSHPAAANPVRRILMGTASFVAYGFLLSPLGFVPATTLEFALLAKLFGGPIGRGAAAGLVFALVLYVLFVYALGLPLPLGVLEA